MFLSSISLEKIKNKLCRFFTEDNACGARCCRNQHPPNAKWVVIEVSASIPPWVGNYFENTLLEGQYQCCAVIYAFSNNWWFCFFFIFRIKELLVAVFWEKIRIRELLIWVLQKHQRTGTLHGGTSNGLVGRKVVFRQKLRTNVLG